MYKGKEFKAVLTPAGGISFKGRVYPSPTAAALAIVYNELYALTCFHIRFCVISFLASILQSPLQAAHDLHWTVKFGCDPSQLQLFVIGSAI
jgi:hypothetical protein